MAPFVVRRVLQMVVVLFGASMVLFGVLFVVPGDALGSLAGGQRSRDPAVAQTLRERYALDRPVPVQYARWVSGLARGDFGESFRLGRPVNAILGDGVKRTAQLASAALVLLVAIGVSAGVISAVLRSSALDLGTTLVSTIAIGFPTFVIGFVLQQVFADQLRLFPASGGDGPLLGSVFLPALTLAAVDAAVVVRLMRGSLLEVLGADFIRTARAKGLPERAVILKHALRSSAVPVVTYVGIAFGTLLGGALVIELVFDWDGVGSALVTAIASNDNPVVLGAATWGVVVFAVVSLLVDVLCALLDPRIRLR